MKVLKVGPHASLQAEGSNRAMPGDIVLIPFGGSRILVRYGDDRRWRDSNGTVYGFTDPDSIGDPIIRCGVGALSLPIDDPLNEACAAHDYAYSSPTYQDNHTREEADMMLRNNIELIGRGWRYYLAYPFYYMARLFGSRFWENNKTNN